MAGRHGVPEPERRSYARQARGQRRRRAQRRDAAQPWTLWLLFRGLLALIVLAAAAWSVLLLTRHQGGIWPLIAVVAGALSLLLIGLDVRARRRQRAQWRVPAAPRLADPGDGLPRRRGSHAAGPAPELSPEPARLFLPDPPPPPSLAAPPQPQLPPPPHRPAPTAPAPSGSAGTVEVPPDLPPKPGRHSHRR